MIKYPVNIFFMKLLVPTGTGFKCFLVSIHIMLFTAENLNAIETFQI